MQLTRLFFQFTSLLLVCSLLFNETARAESATLPLLSIESSATETLAYEAISNSKKIKTRRQSGNGNLSRQLTDELSLPMSDLGNPGSFSQTRGQGKTSDELNVETLGIPLNYAQGGGFDFSIFPSFLFQSAKFTQGPSLSAYDPKTTSGTLSLNLFTDYATKNEKEEVSLLQTVQPLLQQSAAFIATPDAAVVIGNSFGKSKGPSGSLSTNVYRNSFSLIRLHLLGTDLTSEVPLPGGVKNVTLATQRSSRLIPVIDAAFVLSDSLRLKTSFFYDQLFLTYEDLANDYRNFTKTLTFGQDTTLSNSFLRIGMSTRRNLYLSDAFTAPSETNFLLSTSVFYTFFDRLKTNVFLQSNLIQNGTFFGGGTNMSLELDSNHRLFAKASLTPRFSSLVDRYYYYPSLFGAQGFTGNQNLLPELISTAQLGFETTTRNFKNSISVLVQKRSQTIVRITDPSNGSFQTMSNQGDSDLESLNQESEISFLQFFFVKEDVTLSRSFLSQSGTAFPYTAPLIGILQVGYRDSAQNLRLLSRHQSDAISDLSSTLLGGFSLYHLDYERSLPIHWARDSEISIGGRIDNLLDRRIEFTKNYPYLGRTLSVFLSARL